MSELYPMILFASTGALWSFTAWYGSRLGRLFIRKYPLVAQAHIPHAFQWWQHPEKVLFFFRRKAAEALRDDPELSAMRRRYIWLSVLSVVLPLLGFAALFVVAFQSGDLHRENT